MTDRHTMPSGNWIELRDWRELRRGDKKRAMSGITDVERVIAAGYEMTDGLLTVLISNWSYELPLPSQSPQSLDLLPFEDDGALMELVAPAMKALAPQAPDGTQEEQASDPQSPTGPSAG